MNHDPLFAALLAEITDAWSGLPDKPDEDPAKTLRALWWHAAGEARPVQRVDDEPLPALDANATERLHALVAQRLAGTPLAYLTGRERFMGIDFLASPAAMIPRRETEILAGAALALLGGLVSERGDVRALDLCTGSGNVALALAHHQPRCRIVGADLSPDAVTLARANAAHLGLGSRAEFVISDLFAAFECAEFWGQFDLITCNPPYISSRRVDRLPEEIGGFEPRLAFDGGPFGVTIITRALRAGPRFLRPGGWLGMEVGAGQGPAVISAFNSTHSYTTVHSVVDDQDVVRAVFAQV